MFDSAPTDAVMRDPMVVVHKQAEDILAHVRSMSDGVNLENGNSQWKTG